MPTNTNKKMLDPKVWEPCTPLPAVTLANSFTVNSEGPDQSILYISSAALVTLYDPFEDAWVYLPSPALAGTFGLGAAGRYHPNGPSGTATAGSATSLTTNLTLLNNLKPKAGRYFKGFVTAGAGAGQYFEIVDVTTGVANAVFTIRKPGGGALDVALGASSVYQLYTGRFYVASAGVTAANSIKYFDYALGTWTATAITGYPASVTGDMRWVCTPSQYATFQTATATAGTTTTVTLGTAAWAVNQWANSQVRITGGTGAGQIRAIASNTATALTVGTAFTTAPDATSVFSIEGCDDYIYCLGNLAVTLYRYSISANTFTTLAPTAARGGVTGAGASGHWVFGCTAAQWGQNSNAIINGRRIYSFRGAGATALDYYDIAANAWTNGVVYGNAGEGYNTGVNWAYDGADRIVCQIAPVAGWPARFVAFDVAQTSIVPLTALVVPPGTVLAGDRLQVLCYDDGVGVPLKYLYYIQHTGQMMHRCALI